MKKIISYVLIFLSISWFQSLCANEKYALIIGINDYKHPRIRDLHYSEPDANYLKEVLIKFARYKKDNVRLLLGEDATYLNIKDNIYWLGDVAKSDDEVFFYFSGHGTRVEDRDGIEEDGFDEAFCPYETDIDRASSIILDDEIGHWFNAINAKQVVVVLDCCHSGGAAGRSLEDVGSRGIDMKKEANARSLIDIPNDPYARDLTLDNKFILTASDAHEKSYENADLGHGVFTYYIGEAIRGNADFDDNKEVTTKELYDYTQEKTLAFAKSIKQIQNPMCFGELYDAIVSQINDQLCDIKGYDPDLDIVLLGSGNEYLEPGDQLMVRKNMQNFARDLSISDMKVFKIEVSAVYDEYAQATIIEEYFSDVKIIPNSYKDYYAERIKTGIINIMTRPWSTVLINGKEMGETPLCISNVEVGEYLIEFRISEFGYPSVVYKKIMVEENTKIKLSEFFEKN